MVFGAGGRAPRTPRLMVGLMYAQGPHARYEKIF